MPCSSSNHSSLPPSPPDFLQPLQNHIRTLEAALVALLAVKDLVLEPVLLPWMRRAECSFQHIEIHSTILVLHTLHREPKVNQHDLPFKIHNCLLPAPLLSYLSAIHLPISLLLRNRPDHNITARKITMHNPALRVHSPHSPPDSSQQPAHILFPLS